MSMAGLMIVNLLRNLIILGIYESLAVSLSPAGAIIGCITGGNVVFLAFHNFLNRLLSDEGTSCSCLESS